MSKFGLDLTIWGLNMFLVSNVVEIHIIGFFYVQICPDLLGWILCKQNSVFFLWRFGGSFWAVASGVSLCALERPEDLVDQWEGGSGSPRPSHSPLRAQLSCNLSLGSAFCVAGEECHLTWLRKSRLWAVSSRSETWEGRPLPFKLSVVWLSCKVMQFEVCVKIKVLQVGRKSMGKRRDTPVLTISSHGGSKASN